MGKPEQAFKTRYPVSTNSNETALIMGGFHSLTQFFGACKVWGIERGDKFDIIQLQFGLDRQIRDVLVFNNHARRQLLMCKKGYWIIAFGEIKMYKRENPKNPKLKYRQWQYFAYALWSTGVPLMFDIKKRQKDIDSGIEKDETVELSEKKEQYYDNIISEIFGENIEPEYEVMDIDEMNKQMYEKGKGQRDEKAYARVKTFKKK